MNDDYNDLIQACVDSILRGDQAKDPKYGGHRFESVSEVQAISDPGPTLVIRFKDGTDKTAMLMPHEIFRPDKRSIAPGDFHTATLNAMLSAVQE